MEGKRFLINHKKESKQLVKRIASQCAPVLMGEKISNLLIVSIGEKLQVQTYFKGTVLSCYFMCHCEKKAIFLVYHEASLKHYLNGDRQKNFMKQLGYDFTELPSILKRMAERYSHYMQVKDLFPHELGILLGYPTQDVEGFIQNKGQCYLYIGYWKVYHHLSEALKTFERFDHAKEEIKILIEQGISLKDIANAAY